MAHVIRDAAIEVPLGTVELEANLTIPAGATGIVTFVHGSGSSRHSPRNRFVAQVLQADGWEDGGHATLLLDLLTPEEESIDRQTGELRFDIDLLAGRVIETLDWLAAYEPTRSLAVGLFGSSTGAAAALVAAATRPERVSAVVSRGGRPDLASDVLGHVVAPTLLIVGGADTPVVGFNRAALARLGGPGRLELVPGASHLFSEPGALERVARLARAWFDAHLAGEAAPEPPPLRTS